MVYLSLLAIDLSIDEMENFPMTVFANRIALGIERGQADQFTELQLKKNWVRKERKKRRRKETVN